MAAAKETTTDIAAEVIEAEANAVRAMRDVVLRAEFRRAVDRIVTCDASVLCSGVGKAGHIARKITATFSSTGTPSHFLSPADAVHGDLGAVRKGDVVLIFSSSGESDEILRMLSIVKKLDHPAIAITASKSNSLGRFADIVLEMGKIEEACPLRLAPSATTTAMLALGDALALSVMTMRNFTPNDFARFHPAGQLGRKLIRVQEAMTFRRDENLAIAVDSKTVGEVLHGASGIKRRSGAVILIDASGQLSGIFSDSDLRRLVTHDDGTALRRKISDVMTRDPKRIFGEELASAAMAIMHEHRIDELPVVDKKGRPIGLIDIQDLVGLKLFDVEPEK